MTAPRSQRGSSLPETAIVMAVLLALLLGIIDFGRMIYTYAFVAQLARQGARWAIVRGADCTLLTDCPNVTQAQVQSYVQSLATGATKASNIQVQAKWPTCPPGSTGEEQGCTVEVIVTYPFAFMLPWMPSGSLGTISMSSTSEMVILQ